MSLADLKDVRVLPYSPLDNVLSKVEQKRTKKVMQEAEAIMKKLCKSKRTKLSHFTKDDKHLLMVNIVCGMLNALYKNKMSNNNMVR